MNIEKLAYIFLWNITVFNELSEEIISDRNKLFILNFWTSLIRQLEIRYKLFTAYYSQTDEQIKQINQVIE